MPTCTLPISPSAPEAPIWALIAWPSSVGVTLARSATLPARAARLSTMVADFVVPASTWDESVKRASLVPEKS